MGEGNTKQISLLYPTGYEEGYKALPETAVHDLGIDSICQKITVKESEQNLIMKVLSNMSVDPEVTKYRGDVFMDIYDNPEMYVKLMETLDKIDFIKSYGSFKREYDESASTWDLIHRLEEINDYILCVEAIYTALANTDIKSEGLKNLRDYVDKIYHENGFEALKKDIKDLKATTQNLKSVTVGINLNDRFEADSIGLVSVNSRYFTKSNILGNFHDLISSKDQIKDNTEWNNDFKYHPFPPSDFNYMRMAENFATKSFALQHPLLMGGTLTKAPDDDSTQEVTRYIDRIVNHMLGQVTKKLRTVLNKYVTITIMDITMLIPEFTYYVRMAEYIKKLSDNGMHFCKAQVMMTDDRIMHARGIYNFKLAASGLESYENIVTNDLDFDDEHRVYILTGANRGGKTTITQAIGLLYALAQGGIYVPGESFEFTPVDCIYTHFPADEDKTLDLGRLGEECKRFREIYSAATDKSLMLLNETFSTTSFEEGYYIAKDSVKAILKKGISTIYNTHMHKLAFDIAEMNDVSERDKASSLIVKAEGGQRSFKVVIAPPEGMSYAKDIAVKYGVTYDQLIQ